jgi:hypothetical protein
MDSFTDGSRNDLDSIDDLGSADGLADGSADDFGSEASFEASGKKGDSYWSDSDY